MPNVKDFVKQYLGLGWAPVPLDAGTKACTQKGWQRLNVKRNSIDYYFPSEAMNVGVRFRGSLVDIDLDRRGAQMAAVHFFPVTASFGHSGAVTHMLYKSGIKETKKITGPPDRSVILEIRGSETSYTMFPGSVHPNGEEIVWINPPEEIVKVKDTVLFDLAVECACAAMLVEAWPAGGRHDLCLALAGALGKNSWREERIERFVWCVAKEGAGFEGSKPGPARSEIVNCISDTLEKINIKRPVTGLDEIYKVIDPDIVDRICDLLGLVNDWRGEFVVSSNGSVKNTDFNIALVLEKDPELCEKVVYNIRTASPIWTEPSPWGTKGPLDDQFDAIPFVQFLRTKYGIVARADPAFKTLVLASGKRIIDPVVDTLEGLVWDGRSRIDTWLTDYLGVEEDAYSRAIGKAWLISAVARAYEPGCQADYVLVLEGPQGCMKTRTFQTLSFGWYTSLTLERGVDNKTIAEKLRGPWIVELAEVDQMKRSQTAWIKDFITSKYDRYRIPFGRLAQDAPRRCIFGASTNESVYFKDTTGQRRFWPVKVEGLKRQALERDVRVLWAEAVVCYKKGIAWHVDEEIEEIAREVQHERAPDDFLMEQVREFLERDYPGGADVPKIDVYGVLANAHGGSGYAIGRDAKRIMQGLGYTTCRPWKKDGTRRNRVWRKKSEKK